jgi:hypothetical protein
MYDEVKYITYYMTDISEKSKKMLLSENLKCDKIVLGTFIELYLNTFDSKTRLDKEFELRQLLDIPMGVYLDAMFDFKVLMSDLHKTNLFKDSLSVETLWLDDKFPDLKLKIIEKYKYI